MSVEAAAKEPYGGVPPGARGRAWARENLFGTWWNGLLTVVAGAILGYALYRVGRFVLVDARWEIVERNLTNLLVFRFPREELWRLWAALFVLAATFGLAGGAAARQRAREVAEGRAEPPERWLALRRGWPLAILVAVLLVLAGSLTGALLVGAVAVVGAAGRIAGERVPSRSARWGFLVAALGLAAAYVVVTQFGGVPRERWGGVLLTIFLAVGGIVLSFPLGVLLALGRRSSFPVVRLVCTLYIELFRGVPLITVLFMGAFMLGFFLPEGVSRPSAETRALIALTLFTAAYVAEIVRGGLQSVPKGQVEAAAALGLGTISTTALIVLPQALRNVIPAMVGQFISLFKDTSLVFIVGLTELLAVAEAIPKQPDFIAQGLLVETLVFASFVYWVGSYTMSRESQRLERRLGVGTR